MRENERWMDSINGKIQQFNNATQTMWQNAIGSEVVKDIVDLGTELVKIVDKLGLVRTTLFGVMTYMSVIKKDKIDFASILGIHDLEKGWTIGKEGVSAKLKDKGQNPFSFVRSIFGKPDDIKDDVKEHIDIVNETVKDNIKVDTSAIDAEINDVQKKLTTARNQLKDVKSKDWQYYKNQGSFRPAKDRDAAIAKQQQEVKALEQQLSALETRKDNLISSTISNASNNVNQIKEDASSVSELFGKLEKFNNIKLELPNMSSDELINSLEMINAKTDEGIGSLIEYADSLGDGNESLQAYIYSLNGGEASLGGFNEFLKTHNAQVQASGIKAKAAAIGHSLLNAAISMGASIIISFALSAISDLINRHEKLAEVAKEAVDNYQSATSELKDHYKTIKEIKGDYSKLAKGVDELGRNVSLSTEEYERYNEITNKIADMFPNMVSGYTEEGNAIIALKGNVDALTESYENAAQAARDEIIVKSDAIFKTFRKNTAESSWSRASKTSQLSTLETLLNDPEQANDYWKDTNSVKSDVIADIFKDSGVDYSIWDDDITDLLDDNNTKNQLLAYYRKLKKEVEAEVNPVKSLVNAYLYSDKEGYQKLSDEGKNIAQAIISGFDTEFYNRNEFKDWTDIAVWIDTNVVQKLQNSGNMAEFTAAFDLQTQFNDGKIQVDDYIDKINEFATLLEKLGFDEEIIKTVKAVFEVDDYETKKNSTMDIVDSDGDSRVGTLSKENLDIINKNKTKWQEELAIDGRVEMTWDELISKIDNAKEATWSAGKEFEKISEEIDSVQSAYSTLNDAVSEYNENGFLSLDNLQSLLSLEPEYLACLQMENGQLSINQQAMQDMVQARLAEAKAAIVQDAITKLNTLSKRTEADAISDSTLAAIGSIEGLGKYSEALGINAEASIIAAGAATAFQNALSGAEGNKFVDPQDIYSVVKNMTNSLKLIDDLGINLGSNFNKAMNLSGAGDDTNEWDSLVNKYENELALLTNERDLIQAEIEQAEATGSKASSKYYEDLIRNSTEEKDLLIKKKDALKEYLDENKNNIDQDTWTEMNNEINATAVAIKQCTTNLLEYYATLEDMNKHYFDQSANDISRLGNEISFVQGLLEDEKVADESGNWTSAGITNLGLYVNEMERAAASAEMYKQQLGNVDSSWAAYQGLIGKYGDVDSIPTEELNKLSDTYGVVVTSAEEYKEKSDELEDSMYSEINAYADAKEGIIQLNEARVDAIRNGIEDEIEAYEELIDLKKEELDAERDLHDFRNSVRDQTKDIAALERRIAALSGSSAAEDIAERRKLEAQLLEAKEGLNDTYYNHSTNQRSNALDEEAAAFSKSKEKYIKEIEDTLDDAEGLITNSIMDVLLNADIILEKLTGAGGISEKYGDILSDQLKQPWIDAANQADAWKKLLEGKMTGSGEYAALIGEDGTITAFANGIATKMEGPWSSAQEAASGYFDFLTAEELGTNFSETITGFGTQINSLVTYWDNVKEAATKAYEEQEKAANVGGISNTGGGSENKPTNTPYVQAYDPRVKTLQDILNGLFFCGLEVDGLWGNATTNALKNAQKNMGISQSGKYDNNTRYSMITFVDGIIKRAMNDNVNTSRYQDIKTKIKELPAFAKGTLSTKKDQFAITDESWIGEEITLAAGKNGQLQYLKKGSSVMPADISANLIEWGKLNPNMMNLPYAAPNINMINNAVNKPEFNLNFEALVKAERIDENTLPEVKKFVQQEMNNLVKQMNYAIKGRGGR